MLFWHTCPEAQPLSEQQVPRTQVLLQHTDPATHSASLRQSTHVPVVVSQYLLAAQHVGVPPRGVQTLVLSQQAPSIHVELSPQAKPRVPQTQVGVPFTVAHVLPFGQPQSWTEPYMQRLAGSQQVWSGAWSGTPAQVVVDGQQTSVAPISVWQAWAESQQTALPDESLVQVWPDVQQTGCVFVLFGQ